MGEAKRTELMENWNNPRGGVDANLQDQITDAMIVPFSNVIVETEVAIAGSIDDLVINVTNGTGILAGHLLTLYNGEANRVYFGNVLSVSTNAITVDTPLDFDYPIDTFVSSGSTELAVDGSSTPQIFGIRNTEEAIPLSVDITRLIVTCLATTVCDFSTFGDIEGGLTVGIVVRTKNGRYKNLFNAKTNLELSGLMFDFDIFEAINPNQGVDGFKGRMTIKKLGVVIRLGPGEDLQLIIQDNLSSLTSFKVSIQGHVVD